MDTWQIEMTHTTRHVTSRWQFRRKCRCQLTFIIVFEISCDTLDFKLNVKWNMSNMHIDSVLGGGGLYFQECLVLRASQEVHIQLTVNWPMWTKGPVISYWNSVIDHHVTPSSMLPTWCGDFYMLQEEIDMIIFWYDTKKNDTPRWIWSS